MSFINQLLFALLLVLSLTTFVCGEDERDIGAILRDAETHKAKLEQRISIVDARIVFLKELQTLEQTSQYLTEQIEQAEDKADQRKVEQLDQSLEILEIRKEEAFVELDILSQKLDVLDLLATLQEEGLDQQIPKAKQIISLLEKKSGIFDRLFKIYQTGLEEKEGPLEEEIEVNLEIIHLLLELHWAEEENDLDAIKELEAELEELGLSESSVVQLKLPAVVVQPIELSEEYLSSVAGLSFNKKIIPLLKQYCYECHDSTSSYGDLDLEALITEQPLVVNRQHWLNVIQQLKIRSMPPADEKQPSDLDRRILAGWLTGTIKNFDYTTVRQPGYEPARRLTLEEYNNTVRDLFGTDLRPADKFPADLSASSGFDNSANSLFIHPILLERYIGAAEQIVNKTIPVESKTKAQLSTWERLLSDGSVRQAIKTFAGNAYRRPCEKDELDDLHRYFDKLVLQGKTDREAFRDTIQIILISPSFLIRSELDFPSKGQPFRISDYELANRLSYFIWASMPDGTLFDLAKKNLLHQPEILDAQVARMLQDEKASTLGTIFASQWLGFVDLARVQPGQIDNPWATDSLISAMQQESALLFNSIVKNNLQLERLLDADFTYVNEELAQHYQMKDVFGIEMRRVSLHDSPRSGILGHGSIQAITSFPGRTSPVLRGNWVLSKLLGTPPPPPPPNVSEIDERLSRKRELTQRQKLELHRNNPNCYTCHSEIDPLGFGLEQFDWFGRYRTTQRGKPIDSTGKLPSGKQFSGLKGLQSALIEDRLDDLTQQITRKMLSYALGRQLEYYDEATVRQLVIEFNKNNRQVQTLIQAIVRSDTFQMKQLPDTKE
ncbi:MAG: hypothetical protein COA78_15125 [Blastopirellula sp.]|nr:MAG: hypothetical protein COA78_15125 [Blastopirellula sp.]